MIDDFTMENGSSVERTANQQAHIYRHEIINVLMRRQDYESLRKLGGPRPDQISMAFRHYLKLIAETKWRPEMNNAAHGAMRLATYQCPVSKDLWKEIRNLGGRVDYHTIEAIRLFLL
jgi:predicted ArsR family transcriptional regulator